MKKILALVMMLCLLCGAAMAEEVTWADIEPQLAENGLSGDFVVLDQLGLKVWLPTGMNAAAVSKRMLPAAVWLPLPPMTGLLISLWTQSIWAK